MRILFLCHRVPFPPNKGEKIRAFHQLRAMAARHKVDLFTLADDPADFDHHAALKEYCDNVTIVRLNRTLAKLRALRFLGTSSPLTIPFFGSSELQSEMRAALLKRSYDRIYVYCSAMAQYTEIAEASGIPVVVDLVDVDSDKWRQYAGFSPFPYSYVYRREGRLLAEYERRVCARASAVLVTTEREAKMVRGIQPSANVFAIPNGVDQNYFQSDGVLGKESRPTVCFTGDMSYFPNEQAVIFFANNVLPLVRKKIPAARFLIVGRQPTKKVLQLKQLEGVEVTGSVPDVRPYLAQSHVSVAPFTIAAGIQNKILEALSFEIPVVATSRIGDSLPARVAEMVAFADSAEDFASQVIHFIEDDEQRRRIGAESRRRVAEVYSWAPVLDQLLEVLENPTYRETIPKLAVGSTGLATG